jgi:hypothetical protein
MMARRWLAAVALGAPLAWAMPATAQGQLNLYCSVQIEWCQAIATNFQRDTGIRVNMTQRGSGESLAAIRRGAEPARRRVVRRHRRPASGGVGGNLSQPMKARTMRTCSPGR